MPRVDIWIRKEDEAKWKAIKNKPEWLHEHLNMPKFAKVQLSEEPVPQVPPDSTGFIGLGILVDDNTETSTYESLNKTNYPDLVSNTTNSKGVLTEAYLEEQFKKARDSGKPDVSIPEQNAIKRTPPEETA